MTNQTLLEEIARQRGEIARLRGEKELLAKQVVRLVRAEGKLYQYQEQLDSQLKEYEDLYELYKKLDATFHIRVIFEYATDYILKLGYQRVVFFRHCTQSDNFEVCAAEGYYHEPERKEVWNLAIPAGDPLLAPLLGGKDFSVFGDGSSRDPHGHGARLLMDHFLVYPLGPPTAPAALLVVGNSAAQREFYRRVSTEPGALLGIGNIVGLLSSIIATKTAQEKKKLAEARYLSIFENVSEGIFQSIPEGRFVSCNPATAAILGYATPEEVLEQIGDIGGQLYVNPEVRTEVFRRMQEEAGAEPFEVEFYRKDRSKIWVRVSARPYFDANGRLLHLDGVLQDISERKRAEKEILSLNLELEQRVKIRTAQLEEAYREQESFNYSVSHDLRAPLRHINSFSAILQEEFREGLPGEAREYLERICQASARMGKLIDDLLDLSRVSRANMRLVSVDLSAVAGEVITMLRETEPRRSVRCEVEHGMMVRGDYNLLKMLLQNLIGNAWKYTSKREHAHIEVGRGVVHGETAFFVRDNGVGFDKAYAGKLFNAFQRLHGGEFAGSGVGLATVQRIINRHGCRVWAEAEVGRGAVFYFTLPAEPSRTVSHSCGAPLEAGQAIPFPATDHRAPHGGEMLALGGLCEHEIGTLCHPIPGHA